MANHSKEPAITLSVQELEKIIRRAVHQEIIKILRRQPHIFYLEPNTPLYEDMAAILQDKKRRKVKVHSREEAFGG